MVSDCNKYNQKIKIRQSYSKGLKGERGLVGEPGKCSTQSSSIQNDMPVATEFVLEGNRLETLIQLSISTLIKSTSFFFFS